MSRCALHVGTKVFASTREGHSVRDSVRVMAELPRRLVVRGFPHWLKASEKKSLLQHFGATEVIVMPSRGRAVGLVVWRGDGLSHTTCRETACLLRLPPTRMPRE